MAARLVEQHAAAAGADDDGHRARRRGAGAQLGERAARRPCGRAPRRRSGRTARSRRCGRPTRSPVCMPVSPVATAPTREQRAAPGRPRRAGRRCWRRGCGAGCRRSAADTCVIGRARGPGGLVGPAAAARPWWPWRRPRAGSATVVGRCAARRVSATTCGRRRRRHGPPRPRPRRRRAGPPRRGRRCGRSRWSRRRRPGCRRRGRGPRSAPRPCRRRARRRRRALVLGEHLGEVAAGAQRGAEHLWRTASSITRTPWSAS